jgi:divalent metal cation (Fe/Co/Zn/Cd) transporter
MANLALLTVEFVVGRTTGSHAVVADGIHTLVDLISDGVLFLSIWWFNQPSMKASAGRFAWLPSNVAAMLLILAGGEMIWQSLIETTFDGERTLTAEASAVLVAILIIAIRAGVARHFSSAVARLGTENTQSSNLLKAGAWHARADVLSGAIAVVGVLGTLAGVAHLDQLATLLIGCMMIGMGLFQ